MDDSPDDEQFAGRLVELLLEGVPKAEAAAVVQYDLEADDVGTVDRMLEFAARSAIRKAEFAIATPYPGTRQWHQLVDQDRILTRNWSRYNDANPVFRPAKMTPDELEEGYVRLWKGFYAGRQHLADLPVAERTIQF